MNLNFGDHVMCVGEVIEVNVNEEVKPLAYHSRRYRKLGEQIQKPENEVWEK